MIDAFEIEQAMERLFLEEADQKLKFKAIDLQRELGVLTTPGMAWAVVGGKFTEENGMAEDEYEIFDLICLLAVKNVASEKERRRVIHAAVRYVVLKIKAAKITIVEDLKPVQWREVTTDDDMRAGVIAVKLNFTAKAIVEVDKTGESVRRLKSIWTTFTDPADGTPMAESHTEFEQGDAP